MRINLERLTDWMDSQCLGDGDMYDVQPLSGGTQNIMFRFKRADREYIFRHPPEHPRPESNSVMQREGRVLAALADTGVPHPGFIAGCWDETTLGAYFFLMEPIDGFNVHQGLSDKMAGNPETPKRMGHAYVEALAALGNVDYQKVGLTDFGKPDKFLERQAGRWLKQVEGYGQVEQWDGYKELGDFNAIAKWLGDNCPTDFKPGIIHGDCHFANVLFAEDTGDVMALIDWEMSTIGDPLLDLGWVIATWPDGSDGAVFEAGNWSGLPPLPQLIAHYGSHSDRNLDAINWYGVLACFKLGAILEGTYARAQAGKAPMDVGRKLHKNTIQLFNKARGLMHDGI